MKALVWSVATYSCAHSERMRKHVLTTLSWNDWERFCWFRGQQSTNKWVHNVAGVKKKLLDTVKTRKLAYYSHTMRKQGSCLEKMPGRPCTALMDYCCCCYYCYYYYTVRKTFLYFRLQLYIQWPIFILFIPTEKGTSTIIIYSLLSQRLDDIMTVSHPGVYLDFLTRGWLQC